MKYDKMTKPQLIRILESQDEELMETLADQQTEEPLAPGQIWLSVEGQPFLVLAVEDDLEWSKVSPLDRSQRYWGLPLPPQVADTHLRERRELLFLVGHIAVSDLLDWDPKKVVLHGRHVQDFTDLLES